LKFGTIVPNTSKDGRLVPSYDNFQSADRLEANLWIRSSGETCGKKVQWETFRVPARLVMTLIPPSSFGIAPKHGNKGSEICFGEEKSHSFLLCDRHLHCLKRTIGIEFPALLVRNFRVCFSLQRVLGENHDS